MRAASSTFRTDAHVCIIECSLAVFPRKYVVQDGPYRADSPLLTNLMSSGVSIKDIAEEAGTTHSTVSRALRDSPKISEDTRDRIQKIAQEMGYTPNAVAQSLQTDRTNAVGLVVTSIADPFWSDVVRGVEEVAQPEEFSILLNSSHNDPDQEIRAIETFHRRRVDGLLVASSRVGNNYVDRMSQIDVPVVLINSEGEDSFSFLHSVTVDDQSGIRQAVQHLLDQGHRRIGYLGVQNRPLSNQLRKEAYLDVMEENGIEPREEWIEIAPIIETEPGNDVKVAEALLPNLLEADVTAVLCFNDMVAIGVLKACRSQGVHVPNDMSVVGFDGIDMTEYVTPPLTTIHQPKREMGNIAMQMLAGLIEGKSVQDRVLAPRFVRRESTGLAPDKG